VSVGITIVNVSCPGGADINSFSATKERRERREGV
jgi:hypothetical protein